MHSGEGWAQSVEVAPSATPQQAINFVKQNVEQFGSWSCSVETSIVTNTQTLADFNGSNLIIQTVEVTEEGGSIKGTETITTITSIALEQVSQVSTKPRPTSLCTELNGHFFIEISCKDEQKCASYKQSYIYTRPSNQSKNLNRSSSGGSTGALVQIRDGTMAQRIAKAIDFYRKAVASAPSPF